MSDLHDRLWSDAIAEAYALAPVDSVIVSTIELRHPSFIDQATGQQTAVRMALGDGSLISGSGDAAVYGYRFSLEVGAPVDGGETVTFVACPFTFALPFQREGELPSVDISIDNVAYEVGQYLDQAVTVRQQVDLTYREFLLSLPGAPQFVLPGLKVARVKSTPFQVTMTATFDDLVNRNFPGVLYRPDDYRSLTL